jgi:DNA segregation ATPase FtsK/SpoIIIE, S-DNA-T family
VEEMDKVLLTVRLEGETESRDLELPTDIPVGRWLPDLVEALHWPTCDCDAEGQLFEYVLQAHGPTTRDPQKIDASSSLSDVGVWDGSRLLAIPPWRHEPQEEIPFDPKGWIKKVVDPETSAGCTMRSESGLNASSGFVSESTPPTFTRGPRNVRIPPQETIEIPPPEQRPTEPSGSRLLNLLPMLLTLVGFGAIWAIMAVSGNTVPQSIILFSIPMMLGSFLVPILRPYFEKRSYRNRVQNREEKYRVMITSQRKKLEQLQSETREALVHNHPDPSNCSCLELVRRQDRRRLWARCPDDEDFLALRSGVGEQPFQVALKLPQQSPLDPDPLIQEALDLAAEFSTVPGAPVWLSLPQDKIVGLAGPRSAVLNAFRGLVLQLATHHSPDEVKIVAIYPAQESSEWEWLRWLPHVWSDERDRRFLAQERGAAYKLLDGLQGELGQRRLQKQRQKDGVRLLQVPAYVLLLADQSLIEEHPILSLLKREGPSIGVFPIFCARGVANLPRECQALADVEDRRANLIRKGSASNTIPYTPDPVSKDLADCFSRTMAPIRLVGSDPDKKIPTRVPLLEVLGVDQMEDLDLISRWSSNDPAHSMAVPIGRHAGGRIQYLDLHERRGEADIQSGHGPHGLVAGTTGSGKSQLLQSLVVSLAVHFHPHQVAFVLLDFKPPGMAEALSGLPHVINTLDLNDLDWVPRALKSLEAELARRGRIFKQAGVTHIDEYMECHRRGDTAAAELLPYLVLIVDEFAVLRDKLPDTLQGFVQVAIRGRAFGFRMILATQKPSGVVSTQIDANTDLRLCLRVAKPEDSQEVIKRPDASSLTHAGRVYMRVGDDLVFEQFQSAFGGAPYVLRSSTDADHIEIREVLLNGNRQSLHPPDRAETTGSSHTQLKAVIEHVGVTARQAGILPLKGVWLAPLPRHLPLDDVRPARGWNGQTWQPVDGWLCPVVGLKDEPDNQRQPLLEVDLGRRGHLFVRSGPGGDNRSLLRTLVTSLVLDHSPAELHLYCLDLGNLGLQIFEELPHTGAVISRGETGRMARLFRWLQGELDARKQWLTQHGLGSLAETHTRRRGDHTIPPALVLVVDNLATLGDDLDSQEYLAQLTREGQAAGIHLVLAGDKTATRFPKVLNNVALQIGLQFEELAEYRMFLSDCPRDLFVPRDVPGRGMCSGAPALECQVATSVQAEPGTDAEAELRAVIGTMRQAAEKIRHQPPCRIEELPRLVSLYPLLEGHAVRQSDHAAPLHVPFTLDDVTRTPVGFDLAADGPHFLIAGPPQGGKTTALISWLLALAHSFSKEMVRFFLLDSFKRSLAVLRDLPHVEGYGTTEPEYMILLQDLEGVLAPRRREKQIGARPALIVVVDDAELLTSQGVKDSLRERAQRDHPLGFHIILAGTSADLAQGYDPFRKQVLNSRSGLLVGSHDLILDTGIFNLTLPPGLSGQRLSPGRAYRIRRGQFSMVQVATAGEEDVIQEWVGQIAARPRAGAPASVLEKV